MKIKHVTNDAFLKSVEKFYKLVRRVSGNRIGGELFGMKMVELYVIGRRSGERRMAALTAPIFEPGRKVVLVASKRGDDRHPEWYQNLLVNPRVELRFDGATTAWVARTAAREEKQEMWPTIVAAYKDYELYQSRTDREIPVVICEPAGPGDSR